VTGCDALAEGKCCILVPGGVQECLTMEHNVETLFLKKRTGFVKLALTHGAPIVPAFAFGQCNT
jgi:2-acylglycerol O-acyltransferase 2